MRASKLVVLGLGFGGALLAPRAAQAEEGELQLGMSTPFLMYSSTKIDDGDSVSAWSWGIGHGVMAEGGFGITPNLVLGGLFQFSGYSSGDADTSSSQLFLGPKLDVMFMPGYKTQPFVGAVVGLQRNSTSVGDNDTTGTGFRFLLRGGVRAFLTNDFSIDPAFTLGWGQVSYDGAKEKALTVGVMLGISGWVG